MVDPVVIPPHVDLEAPEDRPSRAASGLQREDLIKLARAAVAGVHRPSYCENPASFDPHEWVLEAMELAYKVGRADGNREASGLYPEGG